MRYRKASNWFMSTEVKVWLYDIIKAIDEIDMFLADTGKDFYSFQNSLKTKRAIERDLEIIGEAMSRILNNNPTTRFSSARKIVDTRNRIIHGYDTVSDELVWGIIIKHLPILRKEIDEYLQEN